MILDVEFERSPLEQYIDGLSGKASAARMLALADGEEELECALDRLQYRHGVDISDLPAFADNTPVAQRLLLESKLETLEQLRNQFDDSDPLGMFLKDLAGIPAYGDEKLLAQQAAQREESAGEKLMNLSLNRVVQLALEYRGRGVLLMDLIQEGSIGLWVAVNMFVEGDFETFRDEQIRFAMEKTVVMQAWFAGLGQKMRQAVQDYQSTDERLLAELGRNPTLEEIAQALHMEPSEAAVVAGMLDAARDMQRVKPKEPEELSQDEDQAVEDTAYFQQRQHIMDMLSGLTEQEAQLLTLRYGLEGEKPLSAREAGQILGLTAQQTVELEAAALEKLRNQ